MRRSAGKQNFFFIPRASRVLRVSRATLCHSRSFTTRRDLRLPLLSNRLEILGLVYQVQTLSDGVAQFFQSLTNGRGSWVWVWVWVKNQLR